jgi:nucleoside phosphorylase
MAQPVTTLLCFAVKEEAAPFRKLSGERADLYAIVTGMGAQNTERSFRAALEKWQPTQVITSGFAGGLNPELPLGAVLFSADGNFPLSDKLRAAGAKAARFHCATKVAVTRDDKATLYKSTGADAVEMESAIIRRLCHEHGILSATVRVISDTATEDLPLDFNQLMTTEMKMDFAKLASALMRSPGKIPALMRFQKSIQFTANKLAETLNRATS